MTEEQLIDSIFVREGDVYAEPPKIDQPTARGGITMPTLVGFRGKPCTIDDLKNLTHAEAHECVRWKVRQLASSFKLDQIRYEPLRVQMIDFAYNSGPGLAIRWLQRVLQVERTAKMDGATLLKVNTLDGWLVNEALVGARLRLIDMATDPGGSVNKKFEEGLENRAHTFSQMQIP
jgi:lysozyme family protein